jgi:hypothetical protein
VPRGRGVLTYEPKPLRLEEDHWLLFAEGRPVRLAGAWFFFDFAHGFRIVEDNTGLGSYEVKTTRYFYTLLDQDQRELIAYHFHPAGIGWCTYPHLHIGTATGLIDNKAIPVTPSRPDWAGGLDAT